MTCEHCGDLIGYVAGRWVHLARSPWTGGTCWRPAFVTCPTGDTVATPA